jgi:hypothetical protein
MRDYIRMVFAPITVRFFPTDALIETMNFLGLCDHDKLDTPTSKFARRTEFVIAKELIRRKVRFWEEM